MGGGGVSAGDRSPVMVVYNQSPPPFFPFALPQLPPNVAKLARLEELDLKGNRLATLPAALGTLASLLYLNLADNELVHVPRTLARLSNSLKVGRPSRRVSPGDSVNVGCWVCCCFWLVLVLVFAR